MITWLTWRGKSCCREVFGQRLKIIGKTREARSFTTNPIAFVDYRLAQSMNRQELHNRTTYVLVKLGRGPIPRSSRPRPAAGSRITTCTPGPSSAKPDARRR